MGVAAEAPSLCKGVILCNSAVYSDGGAQFVNSAALHTECTAQRAALIAQGAHICTQHAYSTTVCCSSLCAIYHYRYNRPTTNSKRVQYGAGSGRIRQTCKSLYPIRPERVDDGLAANILRDSCDPGALGIFNAGAKLPFSSSANEMLQRFGGPVLVAQGLLDPLNDARGRAAQFKEIYK
eukprot:19483-Heterococcus_DN1.PRE.3